MSWKRTGILLLLFAAVYGGAIFLQHGLIQKMSERRETTEYFMPSTQTIRYSHVGYRHFLADMLWLRAIQIFGASQLYVDINIDALWTYFQTITDLDPKFVAAYILGNLVIGEEAGEWRRGLAILDKGIEQNPEKYRIPFEAAYFSYWSLEQPELAKEYILKAVEAEDAPDWVARWVAFMDQQMGRYKAAFEQILESWVSYYNAGNEHLAYLQENKLRRALEEWICAEIRDKAIEWEEEHGEYPTVEQLEEAGAFLDTELPDWVPLLSAITQRMETGEPIEDDPTEIRELASRFTRTGWDRLPPAPASFNEHFRGFAIWKGAEPTINGQPYEWFCMAEAQLAYQVRRLLKPANTQIKEYQEAHDGACPETVAEVAPGLVTNFTEPWGGEWVLDQEQCRVISSTYPNLEQIAPRRLR